MAVAAIPAIFVVSSCAVTGTQFDENGPTVIHFEQEGLYYTGQETTINSRNQVRIEFFGPGRAGEREDLVFSYPGVWGDVTRAIQRYGLERVERKYSPSSDCEHVIEDIGTETLMIDLGERKLGNTFFRPPCGYDYDDVGLELLDLVYEILESRSLK